MKLHEVVEGLADGLTLRLGLPMSRTPHPAAESIAQMPLSDIIETHGRIQAAKTGQPADSRAILNMGLSSGDFGQSLTGVIRKKMSATFGALSTHRALCKPVLVRDFKPVRLSTLEIGDALHPVKEDGEIPHAPSNVIFNAGETAQLKAFGRTVRVSRQALLNDHLELISDALAGLGADAARHEHRLVMALINSNPTLADGAQLFDEALGSKVRDIAFTESGINNAIAALMRQKTSSGNYGLHRPAALLVNPATEVNPRRLLREAGLDSEVSLVVTPEFGTNQWALFADPALSPVVGRLHLEGAANSPFMLESQTDFNYDGVVLKLTAYLGVSAISRNGVVLAQQGGA